MDQLTETFEANGTTGQDFGRIVLAKPETEEEPDDTDWQDFLSYHSGIKL